MICPSCGTLCDDHAGYCEACGMPFGNASMDNSSGETTESEKKPKGAWIWKLLCVVFLAAAVIFAGLYAKQTADLRHLQDSYDDLLSRYTALDSDQQTISQDQALLSQDYTALETAYNELQQQAAALETERDSLQDAYDDLEADYQSLQTLYRPYEGRYTVTLSDVYSGDEDYNRQSDTLRADSLDCLCVMYDIHDATGNWADEIYTDILAPDGSILMAEAEYNGHTWYLDPSDTEGTTHGRKCWWRTDWVPGTYRLVFYQGDTVFASLEFAVS